MPNKRKDGSSGVGVTGEDAVIVPESNENSPVITSGGTKQDVPVKVVMRLIPAPAVVPPVMAPPENGSVSGKKKRRLMPVERSAKAIVSCPLPNSEMPLHIEDPLSLDDSVPNGVVKLHAPKPTSSPAELLITAKLPVTEVVPQLAQSSVPEKEKVWIVSALAEKEKTSPPMTKSRSNETRPRVERGLAHRIGAFLNMGCLQEASMMKSGSGPDFRNPNARDDGCCI